MEQTSEQRIDIEKMCSKWKAKQEKIFTTFEKIEQIQVRMEAERKADQERREAERKTYEKMMVGQKVDQEKRETERKACQRIYRK
jgi:hypothetical protein